MLEKEILEQLKTVFSSLDRSLTLRLSASNHPQQKELQEMLKAVASTSDKILLEEGVQPTELLTYPHFEIWVEKKFSGISFRGIPGGHEFSSLILALLYCDGKGKQPDEGVKSRIRSLRGPIRLHTFVSLSCENCPDVVQALNLMASLHPDFEHQMVDGSMAQEDVQRLGVQGVPAVFAEDQLIHSGKLQLLDLLGNLEAFFGKDNSARSEKPVELGLYDVVVVGGGPAGASAAIYSARKGLSTAIVAERFGGQLQETLGIENMISVPYTEGVKLSAQLSEHVLSYPIQILEHRRVNQITPGEEGRPHLLELESGETLQAHKLIVATGAKWRELGVPGEREHIGSGVAFCAHCDGPFFKDKKVAVVGGGNSGVEAAIDLAGLATHVTLLEFGEQLKADGVLIEKLKALNNATIITQAKTTQVLGDGKKVVGLEYEDRSQETKDKPGPVHSLDVDGVFVQIGLLPNTQFVKGLLELTPYGEIIVDSGGRTSVPGIYAAGDVTTIPFKQIVMAMGDGAKAALTAFEDRMRQAG